MKLTTLTAILVISLFSVSASLAADSAYLEERSARLHQGLSERSTPSSEQMMGTDRIQHRETQQSSRGGQPAFQQERWWK